LRRSISREARMSERYPGYDVLAKRDTPSWNDRTRGVIDERMAIDPDRHRFCTDAEWPTLRAICDRIIPQKTGDYRAPTAAMVDEKLFADATDGFENVELGAMQDAWRRGLAAIDAEARRAHECAFAELAAADQDALLTRVQKGDVQHALWRDTPPALFFKARLLRDIVSAYYAHPRAWNEIGYGGPASPRGYVRLNFDRRDPWEASEARPGREADARRDNARVGRSV
jgi:hypothetical protein